MRKPLNFSDLIPCEFNKQEKILEPHTQNTSWHLVKKKNQIPDRRRVTEQTTQTVKKNTAHYPLSVLFFSSWTTNNKNH